MTACTRVFAETSKNMLMVRLALHIDSADLSTFGGFLSTSEAIRIEYPVPVLHPSATGPNILQGVNYASADAGILDNTGSIFTAYSLRMRKITVANIGSTGCTSSELSTRSTSGSCVSSIQDSAMIFNAALKPMTEELQAELPGSTIVYIKSFSIVMNIINNAASYSTTSFYCIQ
ncbi:unnamed protein product [Sphagnum jensenii]|uniref:Uncharacterized protein n=1 Tax=Sphagnum jensenii TaxID=128206 RepID=A0ABP1A6M9_9BRYO